mmetsp:Transcript_41791/g.61840  ORF Transcript_41791/g.61840 Transcript_41791/m.61840 type:complete len:405 (-) Transcript_41791:438-1652(-)
MLLGDKSPRVMPDAYCYESVMYAWARSSVEDGPERCLAVLNELKELGESDDAKMLPTVRAYNFVLEAFVRRGRVQEAEAFLRVELLNGHGRVRPTEKSFGIVMNAWSKSDTSAGPSKCIRLIQDMHHTPNVFPDVVSYNILIDSFARRGLASQAERAMKLMTEKRIQPDEQVFDTVINAWAQSEHPDAPDRCLKILNEMKRSKAYRPGDVSYHTTIHALLKAERILEAEALLDEMIENDIIPNKIIVGAVMDAWSKSDDNDAPANCLRLLNLAIDTYERTGASDIKPNVVMYSTLLDSYARRGRALEAETVLSSMMRQANQSQDDYHQDNVSPTAISFNTVLTAWARSDDTRAPDRCLRLFAMMKRLQVQPTFVTFEVLREVFDKYHRKGEIEHLLAKNPPLND